MPESVNRQVLMAARPEGAPAKSDFQLVESEVPVPGGGQVLCRSIYLSLDPYMRGRMSAAKSYAKPVEIGEVMEGGTVSTVVSTSSKSLSAGAPSGRAAIRIWRLTLSGILPLPATLAPPKHSFPGGVFHHTAGQARGEGSGVGECP